jgi:glucose-6-phosphate dehydrogenase assembly protein OpcA
MSGRPRGSAAVDRRAAREQAVHRHLMRFGEADSLAQPVWEERATSVRAIEQQLAKLWDLPSAEGQPMLGEIGMPHARASVLNLIVVVTGASAADRVVATLMGLGERHPSRAIILVADPGASGPPIDARISAHCHGTDTVRVCYEEVILTIRGESAHHLDGVVAPLLIHDLPTHVWWPGDPPFSHPVFAQLIELTDRVLNDTSDFGDLLGGYRRLATVRRKSGVGDLTWERLMWWQELTAQFFDAPRFRRYLPNLSALVVRYAVTPAGSNREVDGEVAPGVHAPLAQPLLYAAWIGSRLGWRRWSTEAPLADDRLRLRLEGRYEMVDLAIEPEPTDELRPGELLDVRLRSRGETGAAEFIIERHVDEATVATNADGMTALLRRVIMEPRSEAELLSQQLISERRDAIYETAMRNAAILLSAAREPETPSSRSR